jgi:AraC family transcriptional regulator
MEPRILSLPAFTVIGLELRVTPGTQAIPNLWQNLYRRIGEIPAVMRPERAYGVGRNWDPQTRSFDYLAGVEVAPGTQPPPEMTSAGISAAMYAAFKCPLSRLHDTLHEANHVWLPASRYRRADGPEFELYDEEFEAHNPNAPMYFYLPIVER